MASMGPRLSRRGNESRAGDVEEEDDASMGPRLSRRGNNAAYAEHATEFDQLQWGPA